MARRKLTELVSCFRRMAGPEDGGPGDAELLARYVRGRDEAAFELLLWRHGLLVYNVCRRVLGREQDAEDAFQATFLAFVRKAHAIVRRGSVSSWLYKVAYRVALEARARAARTAAREKPGAESSALQPPDDPVWDDLRPILDEEVSRLPERLRLPFVLCYLEGKTNEEAARQLGCRPGTVFSRLSRGREVLRKRLARRGVTLTGAVLAMVLGRHAAEAAAPAALVRTTARAALLFAGGQTTGVSPQATALAEGVLRTMFVTQIRLAALALFALGLLAAGGALTRHALTAAPEPEVQKEEPPAAPEAARKAGLKKAGVSVIRPEPGGFKQVRIVTGRVVAAARQQVYPAVSGYVKQMSVDLGDRVKKGDVLAEIDAPLLVKDAEQAAASLELAKGQFQEAKARVATAEAELSATRSQIKQHEARLTSEKANLTFRATQLERYRELLKDRSIDSRLVDEAQSRHDAAREAVNAEQEALAAARGNVAVKESEIQRAQALLRSAEAGVKIAQVALDKARIQVESTRLVASYDGVVTRRNAAVGEYVGPGTRKPLLTVVRIDGMRVAVDVAETDAPLVRPGTPAQLRAAAVPGLQLPDFKVSRIGFALDQTDGLMPAATMPVEIDVPNARDLLRPGMSLSVRLQLDARPGSLRLPRSCFLDGKVSPYDAVYVLRDGKAHQTPVEVGERTADAVEILFGLRPTDLFVADPKGLSGDDIPVEVKKGP